MTRQDLRHFLDTYTAEYPDDVLRIDDPVSSDQDVTAIVWALAEQNRSELLQFTNIGGRPSPLVTNLFASRRRIERILGSEPGGLLEQYEALAAKPRPCRVLEDGPVLEHVAEGSEVDLASLPLITHFATDMGPYITSGVMVAEDPETRCGNLSYHRAAISGPRTLATSLHSRGDLWRLLEGARSRGVHLPVAMVIGAHPLFMLAASARVPLHVDEREIAGGLFGEPLEVIRTPRYGIAVPSSAEYVLEGVIDPTQHVAEGPFGEFSGYSSDRSTHSRFEVEVVLNRREPIWLDIVGGNSSEHLNLARIPREAEMSSKLRARFPSVARLHYPNSGTHFHCYVSIEQRRAGEARQIMLALLGWDPYVKTVVAVDADIDVTSDSEVLWALATHFQPNNDLFLVDGLPGSPLDPSSSPEGTTARLALDATRGPGFNGTRVVISDAARARARQLISNSGAVEAS